MKIVQIITLGHELYGAQKNVLDLCEHFQKKGNEVTLIVGTKGKLTEAAEKSGIRIVHLRSLIRSINPVTDYKGFRDLIRVLKEIKPDIVASHSSKAGIIARLACSYLKIPNVFTAHGWSFAKGIPEKQRKIYLQIEKWVAKRTDQVIAVSEANMLLAKECNVMSLSKIHVIPYGVLPQPRTDSYRLPGDSSPLVLTMSARFSHQKDHLTLIKALAGLKHYNWQLNLLGDGELQPGIQTLVQESGISDRVHFAGNVSNVIDYLQQTHIFVLITNWEGLPISILEALSLSLPVIASDVDGIKEEVIDEYNGFLINQGDVEQLVNKLSLVFNKPELLIEFSKHSLEHFEKNFHLDLMLKRTESLYTQMIQTN